MLLFQDQLKSLENDGLKQELQSLREEIKQIGTDVKEGSHRPAAASPAAPAPAPPAAAALPPSKSSGDYRGKIEKMSSEVRDDNPYRYAKLPKTVAGLRDD